MRYAPPLPEDVIVTRRLARSLGMERAALLILALCAMGIGLARTVLAESRDRLEAAPCLSLEGGHAVRPGQVIDLQWSEADAIRELEILLSTDGGRHYSVCVSPQLNPASRHFL